MRIIQEADFGEHGSAVEGYFRHLEKVYERSSVLIRNRSARRAPHVTSQPRQRGKRVDWVDQRTYASEDAGGDRAEGDSGEDGSEISSHESDSDGEGDSDEDKAPSKTKETGSTGLRAWTCPRCKNLNEASWIKCNGMSQGEEEEDVCLLARPRYERYRVTQIESKKTIRDGDWDCFCCGNNNFQFRVECNQCKLSKDEAQSDKFRLLEGDETEAGYVSTDNSDRS